MWWKPEGSVTIFTQPDKRSGICLLSGRGKVYTYLHVRRRCHAAFGFLTKDENLKIYKLLLGVSGIGPKEHSAILSVMTTDDLRLQNHDDAKKRSQRHRSLNKDLSQRD